MLNRINRRSFIRRGAKVLAFVAGGVALASLLRQFFPRSTGQKRRVNLGRLNDYPVDTFTFVEDQKVYLYRDHEGVRAVSAVCTHLGCILESNDEGFLCPCHGSCYSLTGKVLSGPAPGDLNWFRIGGSPDGRLYIDMNSMVTPDFKFLIT
ncbi:MAG: Rieske (2Fe-2S) protein [Bacteroidales bacterium]|nr:MAG: Rieske (2Fe-2S) protein [Bacteroidales bacterium]